MLEGLSFMERKNFSRSAAVIRAENWMRLSVAQARIPVHKASTACVEMSGALIFKHKGLLHTAMYGATTVQKSASSLRSITASSLTSVTTSSAAHHASVLRPS